MGAILAVLAVAVGAGVGLSSRRLPTPPDEPAAVVASKGPMDVHVAGWVVAPGVVSVPEGAIVADAIEAAGGLRSGAAADGINLAAEVIAGQQLVVPGPEGIAAETQPGLEDGLIQINSAPASELQALPGVGPVLAERIVSFREDVGPFQEIEDLLQVPGIGEAKLASIRDLVRP